MFTKQFFAFLILIVSVVVGFWVQTHNTQVTARENSLKSCKQSNVSKVQLNKNRIIIQQLADHSSLALKYKILARQIKVFPIIDCDKVVK